mmetsp:Transcript_95151/g.308099  ORF Transcript_95151/g.308099 Transcript_95151/m.308099 type:complete len:290 (+) Transcript_95151:679-1548(+)
MLSGKLATSSAGHKVAGVVVARVSRDCRTGDRISMLSEVGRGPRDCSTGARLAMLSEGDGVSRDCRTGKRLAMLSDVVGKDSCELADNTFTFVVDELLPALLPISKALPPALLGHRLASGVQHVHGQLEGNFLSLVKHPRPFATNAQKHIRGKALDMRGTYLHRSLTSGTNLPRGLIKQFHSCAGKSRVHEIHECVAHVRLRKWAPRHIHEVESLAPDSLLQGGDDIIGGEASGDVAEQHGGHSCAGTEWCLHLKASACCRAGAGSILHRCPSCLHKSHLLRSETSQYF